MCRLLIADSCFFHLSVIQERILLEENGKLREKVRSRLVVLLCTSHEAVLRCYIFENIEGYIIYAHENQTISYMRIEPYFESKQQPVILSLEELNTSLNQCGIL